MNNSTRMYRKIKLLFLILFPIILFSQKSSKIPVEMKEGWKYVDYDGSFYSNFYKEAKPYSNGLAAVRMEDYFGYINSSQRFEIPPQFDVAYPFTGNFALVGKDGKFWIINRKGEKIHKGFDRPMPIEANHNYLVAREESGVGLKGTDGNWVVEPKYVSIQYDKQGFCLLHKPSENHYDRYQTFTMYGGIITSTDTITTAYLIGNGLIATIQKNADEYELVICDSQFNPRFSKKLEGEEFSKIKVLTAQLFYLPKQDDLYVPYENYNGDYVYSKDDIEGRKFNGFILDDNWSKTQLAKFRGKYVELNERGRLTSNFLYDRVIANKHSYSIAVSVNRKWYWKQIKGFNTTPLNEDIINIHESGIQRELFFAQLENDSIGGWVLMNYNGEQVLEQHFDDVQRNWTENGFIKAIKDQKVFYISKRGNIVWSSQDKGKEKELNVNFKTRANAYAVNEKSENELPFTKGKNKNQPILLKFYGKATYEENYNGHALFLINATKEDTFHLDVQDSRLYLTLEAKDKDGEWQAIQYQPNSWCGNSYFVVDFKPKTFYKFEMPHYSGTFKTKVRARFMVKQNREDELQEPIYSNEIEMSVNPGQFWVQEPYLSKGIMDPY